MKKVCFFAIALAAVAMVGCCGNSNKKAAEAQATATEVVEGCECCEEEKACCEGEACEEKKECCEGEQCCEEKACCEGAAEATAEPAAEQTK